MSCNLSGPENPYWKGGRHTNDEGYVFILAPDHARANSNGYVREHLVVAERALGRPLPQGAEVHHVNGDPSDNRPQNLVICDSRAYHGMLHQRQRALDACGNAGWVRCRFCWEYDEPDAMWIGSRPWEAYHRQCQRIYRTERTRRRRIGARISLPAFRPSLRRRLGLDPHGQRPLRESRGTVAPIRRSA